MVRLTGENRDVLEQAQALLGEPREDRHSGGESSRQGSRRPRRGRFFRQRRDSGDRAQGSGEMS